jgi:hypothetical protein
MRQNSRERPAHHANDQGTAFQNPWVKPKSLLASGQVLAQFPLAFERELEVHHITPVRVVEPDFGGPIPRVDAIKATWLGHAVCGLHTLLRAACTSHSSYRALWSRCLTTRIKVESPSGSFSTLSGRRGRRQTNTLALSAACLYHAPWTTSQTSSSS